MLWLYNMTVTTRCSKKRQVLNKLQNSSLEQSYEAKQSKQVPLQKILVLLLLANVCRVKNPDKSSYLRSSLQKSEEIYIYATKFNTKIGEVAEETGTSARTSTWSKLNLRAHVPPKNHQYQKHVPSGYQQALDRVHKN